MIDSAGVDIGCSKEAAETVLGLIERCHAIEEWRDGHCEVVWRSASLEWVPSFERCIRIDVVFGYTGPGPWVCTLRVRHVSLCKLVYGENVHMLYNLSAACEVLRWRLIRDSGVSDREIAPVSDWVLTRVDLCYSYVVGEKAARTWLGWCGAHSMGRKETLVYPNSVYYKGSSYTLKWYHKGPEFRRHDAVQLVAGGRRPEEVRELADLADRVLRVEVMVRAKGLREWFRTKGAVKVSDLTADKVLERLRFYLRKWALGMETEVWSLEEGLARIAEYYGPRCGGENTVMRVSGFYSLLQTVGLKRTKEMMSYRTYYYYLKKLRAASVSLPGVDDLPDDLVGFRVEVPSDLAVNNGDCWDSGDSVSDSTQEVA